MRSLLPLLALLLSACQTTNVTIDFDTSADFSAVKSYAWLDETSGAEEGFDPLIAERTLNATKAQLGKLALTVASSPEQADVLVRYYVGSYTRSQQSKSSGSIGFGSGGGNTSMGISLRFPLGADKVVKEAQIIIDLVNPADKKLKWRGTNRIKIGDESPEEITALINGAVAEIFSYYPPEKLAD